MAIHIERRPGQAAQIEVVIRQGGVPATGLSPTITIYSSADRTGTKLVNGAAMSELGATGLYYYDSWTVPSGEGQYVALVYSGTAVVETVNITAQGQEVTSASTGGTGDIYGTVDDMVAKIRLSLNALDVSSTLITNVMIIRWINHACRVLQDKIGIMRDDFAVSVSAAATAYQLDGGASTYPDIEKVMYVLYGTTPLDVVDDVYVRFDIAAANATVTRCSFYKDADKRYVRLNATPATATLTIHGPYEMLDVASGSNLPFTKRYDRMIEAIVIEKAVHDYAADNTDRGAETARLEKILGGTA